MHNEDAGIHDAGTRQRNVVEHIDGLLHAGGRVDIAAEGSADALQPVQNALVREVLGPVEAHMLEEMGQAVLVRRLLDGAHIGGQIEFGPSCGLVVVTDVVGHAVFEFAYLCGRIIRQYRHLLGYAGRCQSEKEGRYQEHLFHKRKISIFHSEERI